MQLAAKPAEIQWKQSHNSAEMHYACDGSFVMFLALTDWTIIR